MQGAARCRAVAENKQKAQTLHFHFLESNLQIAKVTRNLTKRELKPKLGGETVRQGHRHGPDMSSPPSLLGPVSGVDTSP